MKVYICNYCQQQIKERYIYMIRRGQIVVGGSHYHKQCGRERKSRLNLKKEMGWRFHLIRFRNNQGVIESNNNKKGKKLRSLNIKKQGPKQKTFGIMRNQKTAVINI